MVAAGAWGRMAQLKGGDWLCVLTHFPRPAPSRLQLYRATQARWDWARVAVVEESGRKFDNGNLLVLPDGTVLLTGRSLIDDQSYQLPVYRSSDEGRAWKRIGNVDSNEGPRGKLRAKGLWEPHLFLLPDGRVSVIYSNEKHAGYSQVLSQRVSPDQGATWGEEIRAVEQPGGGALRPGMGVPARLANGSFILVYEIVGLGQADVYYKLSADGVHWPGGLGAALPGHHAGPFVVALTDGRLLVTSCQNEVSLSEDLGKTWKPLPPAPWPLGFKYSWPAIYEVAPGQLVVMITDRGVKLRSGQLGPLNR
jgi:hypothetical protein